MAVMRCRSATAVPAAAPDLGPSGPPQTGRGFLVSGDDLFVWGSCFWVVVGFKENKGFPFYYKQLPKNNYP